MRSKYDNPWFGMLVGLIIPLLAFVLFYFFMINTLNFSDFIMQSWRMNRLPQILSICVASNLAGFFFFLQKSYYYSGRGVIISTFLFTIFILILKYFV